MLKQKEIEKAAMQEELKICRSKIYDMVAPYCQEDKSKVHPGSIGGLKDLFVCSLEISGQAYEKGSSFHKFINDNFLCADEEILAYFDCEQNISAFQNCYIDILFHKAYDKSFGYPFFILLQKIRMVKDKAMLKYLAMEEKEDAYIEWLQSAAFFEICIREYFSEIQQMISQIEQPESTESLAEEYVKCLEKIEEVYKRNDQYQIKQWEKKAEELFWAYFDRLNRVYYIVFFYQYCMELIQDLFSSFRIIVLNEYMNHMSGKEIAGQKGRLRDRDYRVDHRVNVFWEETVKRWLQDEKGMEFAENCLDAMEIPRRDDIQNYKLMISIMWWVGLIVSDAETERIGEQEESLDTLKEYINILERHYKNKDMGDNKQGQDQMVPDRREQDRLQKLREQLADPMWKVIRKKERIQI